MDNQEIKRKLRQINLNLDSEIIEIVPDYLVNQIGFISDIEPDYQIYAALAIISQSRTMPNIGHEGFSKNGINIENVMSHLGRLSKERFLDTLNKQLEKLKKAPQNLKKRVEDIRYSYRFYKKYQTTFEALFEHLIPNSSCKEDFNAFFWVLYLYIKNSYVESENITEAKSLLILIFRAIFESYICRANFNDIFSIMQQKIGAIPQINVEKYEFYLQKIGEKMDNFYSQRYSQGHANFNKLISNSIYLQRLVDDMSNAYAKEKTTLRYYNEIDELSYLELNKNLTPQVFRKFVPDDNIQVISTHLCFDQDEDDMEQQVDQEEPMTGNTVKKPHVFGEVDSILTPTNNISVPHLVSPTSTPKWPALSIPKISPITLFDDRPQSTPISKKIQSEMWINDKISSITQENLKQFETMFTYLDKKSKLIEQSVTIYVSLKEKIHKSIKDYTPKCHNYEERFLKIFSFFLSNFIEIQKNFHSINDQKNESNEVQKMKKRIIGIATLSCEIFNYVHNAISYEFKHHLEVFGTDIKVAIQVFELFEKFVSKKMPIDLKNYVHNTRKRFLVNDIWQNEQGFKLLYYVQNDTELTQIRSKIIENTEDRIRQICREAAIKPKIVSKTTNMMKFILENKPYLLRNNNIDQIILCCLMSCLSINQKQEHQTLQLLFGQYNSNIKFSFNSNRVGLKDSLGNEMKIVEFYNEFFLNEIQDMLTEKQDQLDDFLLTPVRITEKYSLANMNQNFNMMKQKQVPGGFMFNPEKAKNSRSSYRQNILRQTSDMKEEKQQNEQDIPSPTFGRKFTFGGDSSQ